MVPFRVIGRRRFNPDGFSHAPYGLHSTLTPVRFLIGRWWGEGTATYYAMPSFAFAERLNFGHNGNAFLAYSHTAWDASSRAPLHHERGFIRVMSGTDIELLIAQPAGAVEILYGSFDGQAIAFESDEVHTVATTWEVTATRRTWVVDRQDSTVQASFEMSALGRPLQLHTTSLWRRLPSRHFGLYASWR